MNDAKKPNLTAPRFRPKVHQILNKDFYDKVRKEIPGAKNFSDAEIKKYVETFNKTIYEKVLEVRDGVELPESLGYVFIGSCRPKIRKNVDFKKSQEYLKVIQHRNWESDKFLAKIFYTNFESKYRFRNHELWGFKACREFTRTVGRVYPLQFKKYVMIDPSLIISKLFRKHNYKMYKQQMETLALQYYNPMET